MTPPQRQKRGPAPEPPPPPAQQAEGEVRNPERMYVVAGPDGERAELDLVTLIVARAADPPPSASPEQAALLRLCAAPLSVAELSAYLHLPFSAMGVLLTELLTAELVQARAPIVRRSRTDRSLLEAVMNGLQRL
ncbi:conserved hypothetical protein [Streptomyces viridochromogenes DSM 40736]|uniref:DUF742 domain-containing protein n=1 Tax=Streptomyces viridochromogenes (strain DSM 40736 / JCM 4977 / BCRC 1201 / Tue 494) TaxID=591159 RepID=D9WXH6_STRVT|nr:DUF742 domain-containing protein [Streptomyces viridochromogenes]EFL30989.1 conserved hypothetical protein [Streptomyces viridochromogenes DSM 40736]